MYLSNWTHCEEAAKYPVCIHIHLDIIFGAVSSKLFLGTVLLDQLNENSIILFLRCKKKPKQKAFCTIILQEDTAICPLFFPKQKHHQFWIWVLPLMNVQNQFFGLTNYLYLTLQKKQWEHETRHPGQQYHNALYTNNCTTENKLSSLPTNNLAT